MSAVTSYPYLRKFVIVITVLLCFAPMAGASPQESLSPLWQKIEDARAYMSSNKLSEARAMFEQALELAVKDKDQVAEAICIGNLGTLCDQTGSWDDAFEYYKRGYALAKEQNNKILLSKFAGCLGEKYVQKGDAKEARKWLEIQESHISDDDPFSKFYAMYNRANVFYLENDAVSALHYLYKARAYGEENNLDPDLVGGVILAIGDILYKTKRYKEALETYHQGLKKIKEGGDRVQEMAALGVLYMAYKQTGDSVNAKKYKDRYKSLSDSMYEGLEVEPADRRLNEYELHQNSRFQDNRFNESYLLICIVIVLLGIVTFGAIALHKLARRQKHLLDSREIIMAAASDDSAAGLKTMGQDKQKPEERVAASTNKESEDNSNASEKEDKEKEVPAAPMLTLEQQKTLLEKINLVMENVALISREDFNLAMLAKAVNSNTKYVSKVINDMCGKTFKTYLNEYRIREACLRLVDKENFGHLTIKAIHQELGFRTTTSFVAAFRKVMGMTPSEYKMRNG